MIASGQCLNEQVNLFKNALENNTNAETFQDKIATTREMHQNLSLYIVRFRTLAVSYQALRTYFDVQTLVFSSDTLQGRFIYVQQLLNQVKRDWQSKKEQLRQQESFPNLLNYLELCCDELEKHLELNWQKCVDLWRGHFNIPQTLLNGIAHIPGQTELCSAYSDSLSKFNQFVKTLPQQKETLDAIEACVKQLIELQSKMQFDIPENVKDFFTNFKYSTDSVSLQLLSPEVFQWLHNKELLSSFSVQRNWNNA